MKTTALLMTCCVGLLALAILVTAAAADPLDGQMPKFVQKPMVETEVEGNVYYGHDELSTLYNQSQIGQEPGMPIQYPAVYAGQYMADDFADPFRTPVLHVQWWGSYMSNEANIPIDKFLIVFETDVPVGSADNLYEYSHPGEPILSQVVTRGPLSPGSGTFEELSVHPGGPPADEELFMYNAELACPFEQEPNTVYWIKIAALVDLDDFDDDGFITAIDAALAPRWGWHNRDYTAWNPYASTSATSIVYPGEHVEQPPLPDGTEVWHFQDDAVSSGDYGMEATVNDLDVPCDVEVNQLLSPLPPYAPDFISQNYMPGYDGPDEIGQYSKDLAFALYTIPEPSTVLLLAMGLACLLGRRLRLGSE
jgi:hypothetical protein